MHDLECLVKSAQHLMKELSTQSNPKGMPISYIYDTASLLHLKIADVQEGGEDSYIYSVPPLQ